MNLIERTYHQISPSLTQLVTPLLFLLLSLRGIGGTGTGLGGGGGGYGSGGGVIKPAASRFGRLAQMGMGANEVTGAGTGTGGPNQNALGYAPTAGKKCL